MWSAEDKQFMQLAYQQASKAAEAHEIPVGAVIVAQGRVLSKAYNQTELLTDTTAHAEILALTAAFQSMGSKYLPECTLYVTLEPCLMCAGALYWSQIGRIVWGASDEKNGHRKYCSQGPFHPKTQVQFGLMAEECAEIMQNFFRQKRKSTRI